MIEPVLFEQLDYVAREIRQRRNSGFGGMQMLLCGDFLQLPPVESDRNPDAKWAFCFSTPAWSRCNLEQGTVILRQAVRHSGDQEFARVLNEVRLGRFSPDAAAVFSSHHVSVKPVPRDGIIPTKLYCTNRDVERENDSRLSMVLGRELTFQCQDNFYKRAGC